MSYLVLFCSCVFFGVFLFLFFFSVLLALRLPRYGKRELILGLFARLFDLRLFVFICFLFFLVSGKGCSLWLWHSIDFSLTFNLLCFSLICNMHIIWRNLLSLPLDVIGRLCSVIVGFPWYFLYYFEELFYILAFFFLCAYVGYYKWIVLFCHCLFIISFSLDASGRLSIVTVAFSG